MNRGRGFTLLELLVALTLFAVVGGSLLQLFHSGLRTARLAGDQAHAVLLARSKLTELQAYPALQPGALSGWLYFSNSGQVSLSNSSTTRSASRGSDFFRLAALPGAGYEYAVQVFHG